MSRGKNKTVKRTTSLLEAHTNAIMRHGKKQLARRIIQHALDLLTKHFIKENIVSTESFQKLLEEKRSILGLAEQAPLPEEKIGIVALYRSIDNIKPPVEIQSRRKGGDTRQEARPIRAEREKHLAFRFIKQAALARAKSTKFSHGDKGMSTLLFLEWKDAYYGQGAAVKMCEQIKRMAASNQVHVRFRPQEPSSI